MILDIQRRLELAFRELCIADPDVSSFAGTRVWTFGDESHRAEYPCVLFNTIDNGPSGDWRTGWYIVHFQLLGSTFRGDDRDQSTMRRLVGALRGIAERTDLAEALSGTVSARTEATALSVANARYENDVPDEEGQNGQIYSGITLAVVCAPHTLNPLSPEASDSDSPSPSESPSASGPANAEGETF